MDERIALRALCLADVAGSIMVEEPPKDGELGVVRTDLGKAREAAITALREEDARRRKQNSKLPAIKKISAIPHVRHGIAMLAVAFDVSGTRVEMEPRLGDLVPAKAR